MSQHTEVSDVKLLAWNICDGFSDMQRAEGIVNIIEDQQPDVAFFSEAYKEGDEEHLEAVLDRFRILGYAALHEYYNDDDGRRDRHGLLAISRVGGLAVQRMRSRNGAHIVAHDEETGSSINIYGVHLDDRRERGRLWQTHTLREQIENTESKNENIIMGDFNAMHGDDSRARLFRRLKSIWELVPSVEPGTPKKVMP